MVTNQYQRARCLYFGHVHTKGAWQMAPHAHPFHELMLLVKGKYVVHIEDEEIVAEPGVTIHIPQKIAHHSAVQANIEYYLVQFESPYPGWPRDGARFTHDVRKHIEQLMRIMEELPNTGGPREQQLLDSVLDLLLYEFEVALRTIEHDLLRVIRTYIQGKLDRQITLKHLAKAACLSPYYFIRRFKALTGQSPMRYVRQIRCETARMLLTSTALPHKAIAREVGFRNEAELYRVFVHVMGRPPSHFRLDPGNSYSRT